MTTKQLIRTEIDKIPEQALDELYQVIRRFAEEKSSTTCTPGALSKLKEIKIRAPRDFAANLDMYTSGEKHLDSEKDIR